MVDLFLIGFLTTRPKSRPLKSRSSNTLKVDSVPCSRFGKILCHLVDDFPIVVLISEAGAFCVVAS